MLSCSGSYSSGDRTLITAEDTGRVKSLFQTAAEKSRVFIQHEKIYVQGVKYFSFFVFLLDILQNTQHTKIKSTSAVSQGALGADVCLNDAFQYAECFSSGGPGWGRGSGI